MRTPDTDRLTDQEKDALSAEVADLLERSGKAWGAQTALARSLKVPQQNVNKLLHGNAGRGVAEEFAEKLGTTLSALVGKHGSRPRSSVRASKRMLPREAPNSELSELLEDFPEDALIDSPEKRNDFASRLEALAKVLRETHWLLQSKEEVRIMAPELGTPSLAAWDGGWRVPVKAIEKFQQLRMAATLFPERWREETLLLGILLAIKSKSETRKVGWQQILDHLQETIELAAEALDSEPEPGTKTEPA